MIAQAEKTLRFRPRLILAHADPDYIAQTARQLRLRGWEVYPVRSGTEVRHLARALASSLVVLATEMPTESGWLVCNKLVAELPNQRVVLVASRRASDDHAFAGFVGAISLVYQKEGVEGLLNKVAGAALSAAG